MTAQAPSRSVARALAVVPLLLAAVGCESNVGALEHEATGVATSAIVHGTDSDATQDAVVLVEHYDAIQIGGAAAGCSGTLLTPRLVLTARHCVADTDESVACDSAGNPTAGGGVHGDHLASKMYAFGGAQRPDFLTGLEMGARGVEIIDDAAMTLCNHDIALILLDRAVPGAKIAPVRLDGGPHADEIVTVVGWGVSDKSTDPAARQQRTGVKVTRVGPAPALGPAEFELGESGCAGDSGGPALASSGAVLGVLSRGGNGSGAMPGDPALCIGADNIFTKASSFKDLILGAYAKAGQDPWNEGDPDPTTLPPKPPAPEKTSGCAVAGAAPGAPGSSSSSLSHGAFGAFGVLAAIAACAMRRRPRS